MSFSAQGYAILNDRLSPDIAVLEGGYSIETALPYVNVGIILAMAGIDYSHVTEPDYDYDPDAIRQTPQTSRHIEQQVSYIYNLWKNRESQRAGVVKGGEYARRDKSIFYDTDGISEHQEETVRICDECGGLVTVNSRASTGNRIFAVMIPGQSCPACRKKGEEIFESTNKGSYNYMYFQDRDRDIFLVK